MLVASLGIKPVAKKLMQSSHSALININLDVTQIQLALNNTFLTWQGIQVAIRITVPWLTTGCKIMIDF